MHEALRTLHQKDTVSFHKSSLYVALFFGCMATAVLSWQAGYWPITIAAWLVMAHVGHINLFVFHEASHFLLHPNRLLNEANGILVGTFILTPLSVYRYVHGRHHVHLSTEKDDEFWPYVDTRTPRWFRRLAAASELVFGFIHTPLVFLRGVLVAPNLHRRLKRRIALEYALALAFWGTVIGVTAWLGAWETLLVGYIAPTMISGSQQTFRKFVEHMGLYGDTVDGLTRTIDDRSLWGRFVSSTMLHGDIHGPHHLHAKIPQSRLPEALEHLVQEGRLTTQSVYPNYWSATRAMLGELWDPRIGPQWKRPAAAAGGEPAHTLPLAG
jgi:fatty acid desaturase